MDLFVQASDLLTLVNDSIPTSLLVEVSDDLSLLASSSMASSLTSSLLTLLSMVSNVIFMDLTASMIAESLSTFEALGTSSKVSVSFPASFPMLSPMILSVMSGSMVATSHLASVTFSSQIDVDTVIDSFPVAVGVDVLIIKFGCVARQRAMARSKPVERTGNVILD